MARRFPWIVGILALALGCGDDSMGLNESGVDGEWSGGYGGSYGDGGYVPDDGGGDQYTDYGENPWVTTATDAQATFAVDVDTGSYSIGRRYLQEGWLPPPASVRVEEYVNYFDYSYEPPPLDSPDAVSIHVEAAAPSFFGEGVWLLRVGLKAKELPAEERGPANLVFLVDVSGSMDAEDKLPLVKRSLELLLENLRPDDTVGLVTYAGTSGVALEPTPVAERETILAAIRALDPNGSTNGAGGIRTAYALAEEHFRPGGINRVILCTDGDFNVGVTGGELIRLIEDFRGRGITLSVLGFGRGNFNDRDMEQLADHGNGNYAYIDSEAEARRVLVDKLLSTLTLVAKDAKVQLTFHPGAVLKYRLVGYENRDVADKDYDNDDVDGGELGSGHEVTALLELQLLPNVPPGAPLVDVGVRYQPPEGGTSTETTAAFTVGDVRDSLASASDDFRFAAAVVEFAEILRRASSVADPDFDAVRELAAGAVGPGEPADRLEFLELVDRAQELWH